MSKYGKLDVNYLNVCERACFLKDVSIKGRLLQPAGESTGIFSENNFHLVSVLTADRRFMQSDGSTGGFPKGICYPFDVRIIGYAIMGDDESVTDWDTGSLILRIWSTPVGPTPLYTSPGYAETAPEWTILNTNVDGSGTSDDSSRCLSVSIDAVPVPAGDWVHVSLEGATFTSGAELAVTLFLERI